MMKIATPVLAALLLAAIGWSPAARAQGLPQGSYLRSCSNATMQGDALVATCRRVDGREERTMLAGVRRCAGDIGNSNGILQCSLKGGGQAHGQVVAGPGPGARPEHEGRPDYGRGPGPGPRPEHEGRPDFGRAPDPGPGYGPTPSYGAPPPGWERARWERCHPVHERVEELRERIEREFNPIERARNEGRLHELQREERRCR